MGSRGTILVIEDDRAVATVLVANLEQAGFATTSAESAEHGLGLLAREEFDIVLTDERLPGMRGMELLKEAQSKWPELPVVMLTAFGTIQLAVEAMKAGAYDFLCKPYEREELIFTVEKAVAVSRHRAAQPASRSSRALARSTKMDEVQRIIEKAAAGRATVLISGESGTGKSLAARAIHDGSARRDAPFVAINCGALPDTLLESELFGYEKGAFTGASTSKPGRVELAEGGTLFLDEIGDVTPAFQVKLLRLLQERTFERLGDVRTRKADVRFIAATNRDLERMIEEGAFREDLFYRLNVIPLVIPPLRERASEIPELARQFCAEHAEANGRPDVALDDGAIEVLTKQRWPGNVRHLQNFIERVVVLSDASLIGALEVERQLRSQGELQEEAAEKNSLHDHRRAAEREALLEALSRANGNRSLAARILGISRRTLYYKLHEQDLA